MIRAGVVVTDPQFRKQIVESLEGLGVRVEFAVEDPGGRAHTMGTSEPDLLVLDFSRPGIPAILAELKAQEDRVAVIAVHEFGDAATIVAAMRLGAREFLWPPLNLDALAAAVRSVENEKTAREARSRRAKAVGFLSAAGGCGATTIACHTAAELRRLEAGRVTLLDFDVNGGMAGFWFRANGSRSMLDAVDGLSRMDSSTWGGLAVTVQPQLDLLAAPADIPLRGLPGVRGFVEVLRFARSQYDWVVADMAAHLTPLSAALLDELDTVHIVATAEVAALLQARRVIQKMVEIGYPRDRLRVLMSRVPQDHVSDTADLQNLKNMIGLPVDAVFPSDAEEIMEAHAAGRLISAKSEYGKRVTQLAAKLSGKVIEEARPSKFSLFRLRVQEA